MADLEVTFNHFKEIAAKLQKVTSAIVRKAALDIEADAKRNAPVDTGFLKSSVYTVTSDGDDYGNANVSGWAKGAHDQLLPMVAAPTSDQEAIVAVGAEYGAYVEYGTYKAPAQPFLTPAVEANRQKFIDAMQKLEDKLKAS